MAVDRQIDTALKAVAGPLKARLDRLTCPF